MGNTDTCMDVSELLPFLARIFAAADEVREVGLEELMVDSVDAVVDVCEGNAKNIECYIMSIQRVLQYHIPYWPFFKRLIYFVDI